jgi:mRNA interferase RelE/StbE
LASQYRYPVRYSVEFKPRAEKDLARLDRPTASRVVKKLSELQDDLAGDVKKLRQLQPHYRLRVGVYRVLFDLEAERIIVYRVIHRRDAYRS